ncbi:MAG: NADH-quinone oxidoreductase chain [Deltaproteobacteria bacterium]|nr:NADH-quinone oxidoreductase chain [Deltaproteobacteria bacterium]
MDLKKLDEVIERHQKEKGALISILHDIQREDGYIAAEAMHHLSSRLKLPLSEVFRTVSYFGHAFSMQPPQSKHAVKVCQGTACHVKRGSEVMSELKETIDKEGAEAVCDLQPVHCLGCCTAAPAVEIDGKLLDKEAARNTIIKLKSEK